jgi:hypothetical protein
MKKTLSLLCVLFLVLTANTELRAQARGGNSLQLIAPSNELADAYDVGISFNGDIEFPLSDKLFLGLQTGYQSWSPVELPDGTQPGERNTFFIGGGGKYFLLGPVFAGADAGVFFGDFSEFTVIPNVGLRIGKFNIEATASLNPPVQFLGFELGYFWATN